MSYTNMVMQMYAKLALEVFAVQVKVGYENKTH